MRQDYEKLLTHINPIEPPTGLFDRIILAIKKEQAKRASFRFLFFLIISLIAVPVSGIILTNQIQNSGIFYFLSTAFENFATFLVLWQDFGLAILESLPLTGITIFVMSMSIALFTLRLSLKYLKIYA